MQSVEAVSTASELALAELNARLDQLVVEWDRGELSGVDDETLIRLLHQAEAFRNRLSVLDHHLVATVVERQLPDRLASATPARFLVSTLRLSPGEAARRLRAAAAVGPRTSPLGQALPPARPVLAAAQRTGAVSAEQVAIIERALRQVDRPGFDQADITAGEALLTHHAATFAPQELSRLAGQVVDAIDPDGTCPDEQLQADRRHFSLRPTRDGAFVGEFRLTAAAGSKLSAVLAPLARPRADVPTDRSPIADPRTHGQRQHDALEEICDRLLRSGTLPDAGGIPATVILTISAADLERRTGHARTAGGTPVPTDQLLRLAGQADILPTLLTEAGAVLSQGRTRRIATPAQTTALIARDGGCSFPGCDRPPSWCERHHIRAWIDGGTTDLDNLTLLCRYHHHNFAERGWSCRLNSDRLPEWIAPRWVDSDQRPQLHHRIACAHQRHRQPELAHAGGAP